MQINFEFIWFKQNIIILIFFLFNLFALLIKVNKNLLCYFLFINTFVAIACCWCYCIWIFHKWISISFFSIYTILLFFMYLCDTFYILLSSSMLFQMDRKMQLQRKCWFSWHGTIRMSFFFTFKSFINYREINKMSIWLDSFIHYMKRKKM